MCTGHSGGIVAECNIIHRIFFQDLLIRRFHLNVDVLPLQLFFCISRILTSGLDINEEIVDPVLFHGCPHILRIAVVRIKLACCQHTAHLVFRIDLVSQLRSQSRCHQLVVSGLVLHLHLIFSLFDGDSCPHEGKMHQHIDLIKSHPVTHFSVEALKDHFTVAQIRIDQSSAFPGTVFLLQMQRHIKMADGNHRLNAIAKQFINHILIKPESFLIGFCFFSCWENPGPGKRKPITLKAHLCHQGNIFFPVMIHIDRLMRRKIRILRKRSVIQFSPHHSSAVFPPWNHIYGSQAFSAFQVSALTLICSRSAAP